MPTRRSSEDSPGLALRSMSEGLLDEQPHTITLEAYRRRQAAEAERLKRQETADADTETT